MRGAMLHGLWMPLPIMGGDGTEGDNNPPPNDPPPPPPPPSTSDDTPASREATETIRRLRDEIKDLKPLSKELADAKTKLGEYEKAQLTETEKLKKERDEATARATEIEARARQRVIRSEVRVVASELGFADPSDAHRFLDDDAIELDDDGEPKNVKALLEKLAKDKPYLLKAEDKGTAFPARHDQMGIAAEP
jgi:hypothetical protein